MTNLLCTIFLISGASALMFETLWFRQAGLAFGNSVWASSLVLSGFMAGLALGNGLAARERGRFKNPIAVYAGIECLIGVTGIILVYLLPDLGRLFVPLFRPILDQAWLLNPLRLFMVFSLLLIPSTAMGLTLPLLTKALSALDPVFGRVLGKLYGWNTLGAVLGVLLTEFVLIGVIGVHATAWFALLLNMGVAAAAWALSKQMTPIKPLKHQTKEKETPLQALVQTPEASGTAWRYLSAAFLSGFCLLSLEIIWFRFLMLFVTGLSESFSLMLAIVLAGIAFGGLSASLLLRFWPNISREGATIAFLSGLLCILSYALFPVFIQPYTGAVISRASEILRISLPLMFPVSFFSGIFFTLMGAALKNHLSSASATTGSLTLANTIGAALGAFVAGFLLLPVLGMENAFFFIAALYGGTALLLMSGKAPISRITTISAALFGLGILFFPSGAMQKKHLIVPSQRLVSQEGAGRVEAVKEGLIETISVMTQLWQEKPLFQRLITNSYSMSSSEFRSRRYMKLFVYWPIALHPDPKQALLISYGIGSTAKALTDTQALEQIDVVDISRDILDMNDIIYPDPDTHPLNDPRVQVHIEDARYFLQTTNQGYDLITAEPPPPEIGNVVNLYTREYFQLIYNRLNDGGITTYWLPLHALSAESVKSILRAFCDVFEDCSLWHGQWLDLMMVGTRNAKGPVPEETFLRQWQDPVVSKELEQLGFERPEQLGALFIGDAAYLKALTKETPPLIDNFPKRVHKSAHSRIKLVQLINEWIDVSSAQVRFKNSPFIQRLWPEHLRSDTLPYFWFQEILHRQWFGIGRAGEPVIADLHRVLSGSTLKTLALWLMGSDADKQRIVAGASAEELEKPLMQVHLSMQRIANRKYDAAIDSLILAEDDPKLKADAFSYRIYALTLAGRNKEAQQLASEQMAQFLKDQEKGTSAPPLSPFWAWMKENRGIDPFAKLPE